MRPSLVLLGCLATLATATTIPQLYKPDIFEAIHQAEYDLADISSTGRTGKISEEEWPKMSFTIAPSLVLVKVACREVSLNSFKIPRLLLEMASLAIWLRMLLLILTIRGRVLMSSPSMSTFTPIYALRSVLISRIRLVSLFPSGLQTSLTTRTKLIVSLRDAMTFSWWMMDCGSWRTAMLLVWPLRLKTHTSQPKRQTSWRGGSDDWH
jgi:hypothetical protein